MKASTKKDAGFHLAVRKPPAQPVVSLALAWEMNDPNSLAHTKWNCKSHIVFAPKYHRKTFYGEQRAKIGKRSPQCGQDTFHEFSNTSYCY